MTLQITVTRADINKGLRYSVLYCPIAAAVRRSLRGQWLVHNYCLCNTLTGKRLVLPQSAQTFIDDFDRLGTKAVKPFQFAVDLPASDTSDCVEISSASTSRCNLVVSADRRDILLGQ